MNKNIGTVFIYFVFHFNVNDMYVYNSHSKLKKKIEERMP